MFEKKAETSVPITPLLAARWSGRAYDPERPLNREQLLALLEAARWAPSCYGDQPWRFIVCDRHADDAAWKKLFDCLAEGNQGWAVNVPVLVLVVADGKFGHNDKPNRWGQYDSGAAAMSVCMQATDMGLMAHQMGGFNADAARSAFNVPEQCTPMSVMALGYQLPLERIPEESRERELAVRRRKPLGGNFFQSEWGRPFSD